ncbi:hypothetical protein [Rhizobium wuzhouense]|uniref:hypothetical protein n=1 Tax=Rhizobium wuzhouense TaxID=1986026 RepID=UPI000DA16DD2|nr:hypothetical protein [Rhizobium wuzhouense]
MRIGETGLYLPTYSTKPKPTSEAPSSYDAGKPQAFGNIPERGRSSTSLESNLWQLRAGKYLHEETAEAAQKRDALRAEFLDESRKTPAERIREKYLKENGLTEEMLAEMSPEDREAVEDQIAALIKRQYGLEDTKSSNVDATTDASVGQSNG